MKLLIIMFVFLCTNSVPQPDSTKKKNASTVKKEKRASINLAPTILINF